MHSYNMSIYGLGDPPNGCKDNVFEMECWRWRSTWISWKVSYKMENKYSLQTKKKLCTNSSNRQGRDTTVLTCFSNNDVFVGAKQIFYCTLDKHVSIWWCNVLYGRFDHIGKQCNQIKVVQSITQEEIWYEWSQRIALLPRSGIWEE